MKDCIFMGHRVLLQWCLQRYFSSYFGFLKVNCSLSLPLSSHHISLEIHKRIWREHKDMFGPKMLSGKKFNGLRNLGINLFVGLSMQKSVPSVPYGKF